MTRSAIIRLQQIAAALNDGPVTQSRLCTALELHQRTLQRDLEFMRDRLGLPIAFDQRGMYFTRRVTLCACCAGAIDEKGQR